MPFAVFRRHQRKLLAIFAILAMFGFVLADSLPRLLSSNYAGGRPDPVVVTLYNRKIHRSDLDEMVDQRNNANRFMTALLQRPVSFFGDISNRAIVDALILQHEADKLRLPKGTDAGRDWLKQWSNGVMNRELFEATLSQFGTQVSGEQILSDIAGQVRISRARLMLGNPIVTPLDVFHAYRDQNERVAVRAVPFTVADFAKDVPEPSATQVQAYYDKYKDVLPDAKRDTPGFKVPRQVRVEVLSIDGAALARGIKDTLTESEIQTYYENRKSEFKRPSEFPDEIFLGAPELTPPLVQSLAEVRPYITTSLADEKAQTEIVNKFAKIKDEVMIPFANDYLDAVDLIAEAKKQHDNTTLALPKAKDLKDVAKTEKLEYEMTPLLDREQAEHYGELANSEVGLTRLSGGRKFALEFFAPKSPLYEPVELTDPVGRRYLARKTEDNPPHVPALDEIRAEVVRVWKLEQARPLAEKAADTLAATLRKEGGKIKGDTIQGHAVLTTRAITKLQPGFPIPGQFFQFGAPTASEIAEIPDAGDTLRDSFFSLEDGAVAVAPNQPKTVYYVLTLDRRIPATFATLYAPTGEFTRYSNEARTEAARRRDEDWMKRLRADAGVPPDWVPPDEANRDRESGANQG